MFRRPLYLVLPLILGAGACERAATGPSIPDEYLSSRKQPGSANTLPVLFGDALLRIQRLQGLDHLEGVLGRWSALQAEVQAAHAQGDRKTAQAKLHALHAEELRIVVETFGSAVVTRAITETSVALGMVQARLGAARASSVEVNSAEASALQVNGMLARARVLLMTDPAGALAVTTQAAKLLAGIDNDLVEIHRIRAVEQLFPVAARQLASTELELHGKLLAEAQAALRKGDRRIANERLAAVRSEEIRLVVHTFGPAAATRLINELGVVISELKLRVDALHAAGHDVTRFERMLGTATDLHNHASIAEQKGDAATALDLGSHAAGLLNSLQHLTSK